jgi:hypothetical protein
MFLQRSTARYKLDFTTKQIRSRCWWAIYGLERSVTIIQICTLPSLISLQSRIDRARSPPRR